MSNRFSLKNIVHKLAVKNPRRLSVYVGLCLGAVILALAALIFMFGGDIINGYVKGKVERAFDIAHPGSALRIGKLDYAVGTNCLVAQSVILNTRNSTFKSGRISVTGVRWLRLLWGTPVISDILYKARLDATNLDMKFLKSHYGIRSERLWASVPDSELVAEGNVLSALIEDEKIFASSAFRTTRFRVVVPEFKVSGLAYSEMLKGKSYRARSVQFYRPSFDALVNRDKPVAPFVKSPLMVNEALSAIRQPVQIDNISITDGYIRYCERVVVGADPGVLTFTAVNMSVEGIANRGKSPSSILLKAQCNIMDAGVLKVLMTIPVASPDFSFHYSGSLSAMDLTRLDAFLEIAEHLRIKSGSVKELAYEIDVTAGHASGHVRAIYKDLNITVLDKKTGTEKGLDNRVASFLVNTFKIKNSKVREVSSATGEGKVNYARRPEDEFMQFVWFALRSGVLDVIKF